MGSGDPPGLQNRRKAGLPVFGAFDSHTLPPFQLQEKKPPCGSAGEHEQALEASRRAVEVDSESYPARCPFGSSAFKRKIRRICSDSQLGLGDVRTGRH